MMTISDKIIWPLLVTILGGIVVFHYGHYIIGLLKPYDQQTSEFKHVTEENKNLIATEFIGSFEFVIETKIIEKRGYKPYLLVLSEESNENYKLDALKNISGNWVSIWSAVLPMSNFEMQERDSSLSIIMKMKRYNNKIKSIDYYYVVAGQNSLFTWEIWGLAFFDPARDMGYIVLGDIDGVVKFPNGLPENKEVLTDLDYSLYKNIGISWGYEYDLSDNPDINLSVENAHIYLPSRKLPELINLMSSTRKTELELQAKRMLGINNTNSNYFKISGIYNEELDGDGQSDLILVTQNFQKSYGKGHRTLYDITTFDAIIIDRLSPVYDVKEMSKSSMKLERRNRNKKSPRIIENINLEYTLEISDVGIFKDGDIRYIVFWSSQDCGTAVGACHSPKVYYWNGNSFVTINDENFLQKVIDDYQNYSNMLPKLPW